MIEQFKQFIESQKLFSHSDNILVTTSGGSDSMVLCALLMKSDYKISIAHCNFHLRGSESDGDQKFVESFAKEHHIEFFTTDFNTTEYAQNHSVSIEMAARDLRYNWFRELAEDHHFTKVAIAHHSDDQIETFFINLMRGSGIHGLKGMKPSNELFVRPLLFASREQIHAYAIENNIAWRDDRTNSETIYLRNKIRHEVLPQLDSVSEHARKSINASISYLANEDSLYRELIDEKLKSISVVKDNLVSIEKKYFVGENGQQLLFEWLRNFGFSMVQCSEILTTSSTCGRIFLSSTHRVVEEKSTFDLTPLTENQDVEFDIQPTDSAISEPIKMAFTKFDRPTGFEINKSRTMAQLDFEKLSFPLRLRRWKQGDRFRPLGMKGSKLVSDFFNDLSFSNFDKENTWLLVSNDNQIVWIVGQRIDDRFAITTTTRIIFQCSLF